MASGIDFISAVKANYSELMLDMCAVLYTSLLICDMTVAQKPEIVGSGSTTFLHRHLL
jgi:hypothetical protein